MMKHYSNVQYLTGVMLLFCVDVPPSPRRVLTDGDAILRYLSVTKADTQVVQCNVSNRHGYLFANIVLTVIGQCIYFNA
jgi:hypothetical protein